MSQQWQQQHSLANEEMKSKTGLFSTLVSTACDEGAENEKCVVAQYRTTLQQREMFAKHLLSCSRDCITIEWVIDIADEINGWFYGTAYHYNDLTQMLHVMVPDKLSPSFDGHVMLDYRSVHLIECVDGVTDALYNKIVRDSTIKVRWDIDWLEEEPSREISRNASEPDEQRGRWKMSCARYYIRIANQVLVEDDEVGYKESESRGFVMLTADTNLRLKHCLKGKGQDDFDRLIIDGSVLSSPDVLEAAKSSTANAATSNQYKQAQPSESGKSGALDEEISVRKIADMSRGLKECLSDLLEDRDKTSSYRSKMTRLFQKFALSGDLNAGLSLLADAEEQAAKDEKKKRNEIAINNGGKEDLDDSEALADEAWVLIQRLERSAIKLLKAGGDAKSSASEELEFLRKSQKRMKKELEEKDRELQALYAARAR